LRSRRLDLEEPQPLEVIPTEEQKQDHNLKKYPKEEATCNQSEEGHTNKGWELNHSALVNGCAFWVVILLET
jgi:hypothetical protein